MSLSWVEATRLSAKGGPDDRLRRWLMTGCAALATMLVAAAATIPSQMGEVWSASVLGPLLQDTQTAVGVLVALAVLAVPVLHLMSQAVRVGAPARERRLSAMRMAGATRGEIRQVVRMEALACGVLGAVLGVAGFYAFLWAAPHVLTVRYEDHGEDIGAYGADVASGTRPVIALDVWPHPLTVVAAALVVPLVAALVVPLTARRVAVGASRVVRDDREMSPTLALGLLGSTMVAGTCVLAMIFVPVDGGSAAGRVVSALVIPLFLATCGMAVCLLVVSASGVAARLGAVLARSGRPAAVLAGRMMQAHPRLAARSAVSLVLVGLVGGVAVPLQGVLESEFLRMGAPGRGPTISPEGVPSSDLLYYTVPVMAVQALAAIAAVLGAVGLVVAVSEQVGLRGRDLARQVAVGVPRAVVRRALLVEAASPVAIMATLALVAGAAIPVLSVTLTGNAELLDRVLWGRLAGLWVLLVGAAVAASWLGGLALPSAAEPQRIRDRE